MRTRTIDVAIWEGTEEDLKVLREHFARVTADAPDDAALLRISVSMLADRVRSQDDD